MTIIKPVRSRRRRRVPPDTVSPKLRRLHGFTLLELLIVLLLAAILAMLSWPALNAAMGNYRLEAAAEEIVNALEYAQLQAAAGGQTRVTISATAKRIDVQRFKPVADLLDGSGQYAAAGVEGGSFAYMENPMNRGSDYFIIFPIESRFDGVDISASDFGSEPVSFDTTGTPSKGGTVTLTLGGRQRVVTLNVLSGRVSVSG